MDPTEMTTAKNPTLSELLMRAMDEDDLATDQPVERERWDEDEGAFGG